MNLREVDDKSSKCDGMELNCKLPIVNFKDAVCRISSSFRLGPINLEIKRGSFVGVFGRVGSGKSVFLRSILGEVDTESGDICLRLETPDSGIGYLPQEPWIQNTTIRNNILFGKHYDYAKVPENT